MEAGPLLCKSSAGPLPARRWTPVVLQYDNMAKPDDCRSPRLFCTRMRLLQKAFSVIPAKAGIRVFGGFLVPVPRSARDSPG